MNLENIFGCFEILHKSKNIMELYRPRCWDGGARRSAFKAYGSTGGISNVTEFLCVPEFHLLILSFYVFQNPQSDWAVLKTVLFYSVLILVLPIGSFFATKSLLFEWFLGQVCLDQMISLLADAWFHFCGMCSLCRRQQLERILFLLWSPS